jgi:hypothetical protein
MSKQIAMLEDSLYNEPKFKKFYRSQKNRLIKRI